MNKPFKHPNQQQISANHQVIGCPIMIDGLKKDAHIEAYNLKRARCPFDAGFDLFPCSSEPMVTPMTNGMVFKVDTMIRVSFPPGTYGMITERSSSCYKLGAARVRTGIIDSGYVGDIFIELVCLPEQFDATMTALKKCVSDRVAIAQMIVMPHFSPVFCEWDDRNISPGRGKNGYGSSDLIVT